MTRTEIKDAAKQMVLDCGPSNTMEFGGEYVVNNAVGGLDASPELQAEILAEARKQARRVYEFFGYDCPWGRPAPLAQRGDI